jgi:actin-related protein
LKLKGLCLNSGFDQTYCAPVYEGKVISHAIKTMNFGGNGKFKNLKI